MKGKAGSIVYFSSSFPSLTVAVKKEILDLNGLLIQLCGLFILLFIIYNLGL